MPFDFDHVPDRRPTNSSKWNQYPEDVLPMWVADMDFRSPPAIVNALRSAVDFGVFGYDLAVNTLRRETAGRMSRLYAWQIDPDMVVVVPGIVSGFNAAAWSLCRPGEGILMQVPVYFPFLSVHENVGLVQQAAALKVVRSPQTVHYEIDFDVFKSSIHSLGARTAMFLMCNPQNPTGNMFGQAEQIRMAELCLENDIPICSDEIHSELILNGGGHLPMATLSPEIADRTITLVSPSKTFNTAGLFCGMAIIPNEKLREQFNKQIERLTLHPNSFGILAAQAAFSGDCDDWLGELRVYLKSNRDYLVEFVAKRLPGIRTTIPDATYLAWLDCTDLMAQGRIQGAPYDFFLKEAKVALNDGATFGEGGAGFVRLNFGCPRSILVEALQRMENSLSRSG